MHENNQGLPPTAQAGKSRVWKVYVGLAIGEVAVIAGLLALHMSWGVIELFMLFALILAFFGNRLTGSEDYIQIANPAFETRIQNRYRSESSQLMSAGFSPLFFSGEAFPLARLLLIYPIVLFLTMLLNGEVATVMDSKLVFGYPIFISGNKKAFAHPLRLGMKYHTLFQDSTILMTKNFSGKTDYGPFIIVRVLGSATIREAWDEHLRHVQALEAEGKQVDGDISFRAFADISHCA